MLTVGKYILRFHIQPTLISSELIMELVTLLFCKPSSDPWRIYKWIKQYNIHEYSLFTLKTLRAFWYLIIHCSRNYFNHWNVYWKHWGEISRNSFNSDVRRISWCGYLINERQRNVFTTNFRCVYLWNIFNRNVKTLSTKIPLEHITTDNLMEFSGETVGLNLLRYVLGVVSDTLRRRTEIINWNQFFFISINFKSFT